MAKGTKNDSGHVQVRAQLSPRLATETRLPEAVRNAAGSVVTFTTRGSSVLNADREVFRVGVVIGDETFKVGSGAIGFVTGAPAGKDPIRGCPAVAFMQKLGEMHAFPRSPTPTSAMLAPSPAVARRRARATVNPPGREVQLR